MHFLTSSCPIGVQNVTVTEVNSSTMKFNWSLSAVPKHIPLYYLICHPDESFHGDIVQFTRLTSLVLTGFAVGIEYTCTLSTMGTSEKIQKYSVRVQAKRLGESWNVVHAWTDLNIYHLQEEHLSILWMKLHQCKGLLLLLNSRLVAQWLRLCAVLTLNPIVETSVFSVSHYNSKCSWNSSYIVVRFRNISTSTRIL